MINKNFVAWAIVIVVIILGLIRVIHLVQNALSEEPWLRIIYFLVSVAGLGLCVKNLVKLLQIKFAASKHLMPFMGLFIGSILSLWIFMDEIGYFIFNVLERVKY